MPNARPNIVLFITDQQRGDCLGLDPRSPAVLQTPTSTVSPAPASIAPRPTPSAPSAYFAPKRGRCGRLGHRGHRSGRRLLKK